MKRYVKVLLPLLFSAFLQEVSAQGPVFNFGITSIVNFPASPADTVYEGQAYNYTVIITNNSNTTITGAGMSIMMKVDTITTLVDSINTPVTLTPGDTLSIPVTNYLFTQPQFKAGNNIVVVWPIVNGGAIIQVDSFFTAVEYVTLSSLGEAESPTISVGAYPVPARDYLWLDLPSEFVAGRVRILDVSGRLVNEQMISGRKVDMRSLPEGMYFIRLEGLDETRAIRVIKTKE